MIGPDMLCFQTWLALRESGIFVNPIISPAVQPGQAITVGLFIQHVPEYHTYWKAPGIVGVPTTINWKLPGL